MEEVIVLGICIALCAVLIQDWRSRSIHIAVLGLYLALAVPFFLVVRSFNFYEILMNLAYVTILLGIAFAVVAFRKRMKVRYFFGTGDILFLYITTLYFDFPGFVIWLNVALIVCLLLHFVATYISDRYRKRQLVPLAGFLAVVIAPALILEIYVRPVSFFIYPS